MGQSEMPKPPASARTPRKSEKKEVPAARVTGKKSERGARASARRTTTDAPRQRLSVDERRDQLLELGVRAFTARPYDEVSVDEIAREAGISRSLLFHYFPSKRDFHVAVIEDMAMRMLAATFQPRVGNLQEQLMAGLEQYFAFVEQHVELFLAVIGAALSNAPGAQEVVERTREEMADRIRIYLPEPPAGEQAMFRAALRAWAGLVETLALDWARHRDLSRSDRIALALRATVVLPGLQRLGIRATV